MPQTLDSRCWSPQTTRVCLCGLFITIWVAGCVTPFEKKALLKDDHPTLESVQGPTERRLRDRLWRREQEESALAPDGSLKALPGTDEFNTAKELYDAEEYAQAEEELKKVAKKFKKSGIREDALFYQAEAAYEQNKLARAHDLYTEVLADYPSTRHLDTISRRLFKVAMVWLDQPDVVQLDEIRQVDYEQPEVKLPATNPSPKKSAPVFLPNFTDKSRPYFDTSGNALAALKSIWMNDPTGPLADDAVMLAASYYARQEDWVEADRMFTLLREQFPQSPHVQTAFELGSHVKLMSYQGAAYDGKTLDDAEKLKRSLKQLYPNADQARIESELSKIEVARAARIWEQVVFYQRKNLPRSVAVNCHLLLKRFPNSPYAEPARKVLAELGPEYSSGAALLSPHPDAQRTVFGTLTNTNPGPRPVKLPPVDPMFVPQPDQEAMPPSEEALESEDGPLSAPPEEVPTEDVPPPKRRGFWPFTPPPQPLDPNPEAKELRIESAENKDRSWNPFRRSEVQPANKEVESEEFDMQE